MGRAPDSALFLDTVSRSLSAGDVMRVRSAWALARSAHSGQTRQSGEPYDTHPLAVAGILFDLLGPDADALCAALLHDVVEDSDTSLSSIRTEFGHSVAHIVDGVSKLDLVRTPTGCAASSKEDTLRKLVAAGGQDWRVFAVKLCDRLHNMRTLGPVSQDKQRRVAVETRHIYVPLARYVGFQQIATELEALSLRCLFPKRWAVISKWVAYKSRVDHLRLRPVFNAVAWGSSFGERLGNERVANEMTVRCFELLRGDRACRALFSIPTVFDLCASIEDAYMRSAILHRHFGCLPASFVSHALEGMASSKVLLSSHALVAEFVFFFPRIPRAGYGLVVAEGVGGTDFAAVASAVGHPGNFTRVLRELVEHTAIAVFSPKGQRLSLPRHASGLDFAFAVHTDLGLRASAVRVNGRLCEVGVELSSGDIVEVIASDRIVAVPEWETVLRSPRSRAKLRHWMRETAHDDAAVLGRRLLADAAGLTGTDDAFLYADTQIWSQSFGVSSREDIWYRIGSGDLSAFAAASLLLGSGAEHLLRLTSTSDVRSRLLLDGRPAVGIQYCDMCMPVPGDAILAVSSFSGVRVHRLACPRKIEGRASNDVFAPMWASRIAGALPTEIRVKAADRKGLLADCSRAVTDCGIDVIAVSSASSLDSVGPVASLAFTLVVKSGTKLALCISALSAVPGVVSAVRADTSSSRNRSSQRASLSQ